MNQKNVIPKTYQQWRHCIEVLGEVELTAAYISKRLAILEDDQHIENKNFSKLYGDEHLQRTVEWFRRAANERT